MTLSDRNIELIFKGRRAVGTFTDGFYTIDEYLKIKDADTIESFCQYLDTKEKVGTQTIKDYYLEFMFGADFIESEDKGDLKEYK